MPAVIIVDTREPESYANTLRVQGQQAGIQTLNAALPEGDYLWERDDGSRVLVERKTMPDLVHSLQDGRWQDQIARLLSYEVPIVLLQDGTLSKRAVGSGWTTDSLDAVLLRAQCAGVLVARCRAGEEAVAARLISLHRQTTEDSVGSLLPPRRHIFSFDPQEAAALGFLAGLPGCGEKTARKLIEQYGSVWAAVDAIAGHIGPPFTGTSKAKLEAWKELLAWRRSARAA